MGKTDLWFACFGVMDKKQTAELIQWIQEDMCFAYLMLNFLACENPSVKLPDADAALIDRHSEACSACWENVLIASRQASNPAKRKIYLNVYYFAMWSLMRKDGGGFEVEEFPGGLRFTMKYPSYVNAPWTGGELVYFHDPTTPSELIMDVKDEDSFENPDSVKHSMDGALTNEIKSFDRPGGESIQWWSILDDRPCRLVLRWQGKIKQIADDWRLHPRYAELVRRHRRRFFTEEESRSLGDEALRLRDMALEHDGRSRFAGFLNRTLPWRDHDDFRRESKDAFGHLATSPEGESSERTEEDETSPLAQIEDEGRGGSRAERDETMGRLDMPRVLQRLWADLDEEERRILELKSQGLSDAAVGERVGLVRETVNRKMRRIRGKAARLRG